MRASERQQPRCSYVVLLDLEIRPAEQLRELAASLSELSVAGCEVIVVDPSSRPQFDLNARSLRWVARHLPVTPEYRGRGGEIEITRAAAMLASCDRVVVTAEATRWPPTAIDRALELLEVHDFVAPYERPDRLSWWHGIDAVHALVDGALGLESANRTTLAFRRLALFSAVRRFGDVSLGALPRAAETHVSAGVVIQRNPAGLREWSRGRVALAARELERPVRSALCVALLPLLLVVGLLAGIESMIVGAVAVTTGAAFLALSGKISTRSDISALAVLFTPLWLLERSLFTYVAMAGSLARRRSDSPVSPEAHGSDRAAIGE